MEQQMVNLSSQHSLLVRLQYVSQILGGSLGCGFCKSLYGSVIFRGPPKSVAVLLVCPFKKRQPPHTPAGVLTESTGSGDPPKGNQWDGSGHISHSRMKASHNSKVFL